MSDAENFYNENYEKVLWWSFIGNNRYFLLGNKADTCRFCQRSKDRDGITFDILAHAVPEMIGNKVLFTRYECDECNNAFGCTSEHHLGAYLKPYRALSGIFGKKRSFRLEDQKAGYKIEASENGIFIEHAGLEDLFIIDEVAKTGRSLVPSDPYVPLEVYKAFVKIGLSLIPETDAPLFTELLRWVRFGDGLDCRPCLVAETMVEGWHTLDPLTIFVLRRRSELAMLPYMMFVVRFGNYSFQISLACPQRDAHIYGNTVSFPTFPTPLELNDGNDKVQHRTIDLSSDKRVVGEIDERYFKFDDIKYDGRSD